MSDYDKAGNDEYDEIMRAELAEIFRPTTPSELIARIRVLMNERMQITQDYQQRFTRVTEEIQAYQRQLHEAQAAEDHDMPF